MSDTSSKAPSKSEAPASAEGEGEGEERTSWLSWGVGWVLLPGAIIGVIFGGGVLVGAHFHDSWFARLIVWFAELF